MCHSLAEKRQELGIAHVDDISRHVVCGYDLRHAVRNLTPVKLRRFSLCEILRCQDQPGVVWPADDFLSFIHGESLEQTLLTMMLRDLLAGEVRHYWLDDLVLRPSDADVKLQAVKYAIKRFGSTAILAVPVHRPVALRRVFRLYELGCTVREGGIMQVLHPPKALDRFVERLVTDFETIAENFGHVSFVEEEMR
jgi:hypothetical protein